MNFHFFWAIHSGRVDFSVSEEVAHVCTHVGCRVGCRVGVGLKLRATDGSVDS